jgi:uncharacterized protein (TIGR03435 family)
MILRFLCVALVSSAVFGQATVAFEASVIHASAKTRFAFMRGPTAHGDRYEIHSADMVDLINAAYGVTDERVLGGPAWLETDRFDIIAKMPENSTPEAQKAMLQALLADRFKLVIHKDTKPIPAFALTAGKHPALKKSEGDGEGACKFVMPPPPPPRAPGDAPFLPTFTYECRNMTMKAFADGLINMNTFQYLNQQAVVDQTELEGAWDFTFKYTPRGGPVAASDVVTLFDAFEKQLGLKLVQARIPMQVIVVDSANEKPTDNAPGIGATIKEKPLPTEFEVAEVKPSDPENKRTMFQIQRGGRVNMTGVTLKLIIEQAWNLSDDMLLGAPKWLDTDRFEIIAKVPAEESNGDVDIDTIWQMLRGLLKERFHLAVHFEEKPVASYTLVSTGKPKMKKADPTGRTKFYEGPAPDGKDPRVANPILSRLVTCQNMTMAQLAERLQDLAPGYIHTPVLDATGIEGAYDFTLSFSPAGALGGGRGGGGRGGDGPPPAASATDASDPSGGITLLEAVEKQLGLKLELQKRPVQVLVIDHVDQKPTDN